METLKTYFRHMRAPEAALLAFLVGIICGVPLGIAAFQYGSLHSQIKQSNPQLQ